MSCYIGSNENRIYVAEESVYCEAGAASAEGRIPAIKLAVTQTAERPERRDKTGGRTFLGLPAGLRKRTAFDLTAYMTAWESGAAPCYGPLFRAALGGAPLVFNGATIASVPEPLRIVTGAAHGLVPGQAVRFGGEIRFVTAVVDATTFVLNAAFSTAPAASGELGRTVTYVPGSSLPSVTVFDHWSPEPAVQRILAGTGVDRLRIDVNGDYHQFGFRGVAGDLIDSAAFVEGAGGLAEFPSEPEFAGAQFPLIPGSLGQAWLGATPTRFHTLLSAEVILDNNIDQRSREFGMGKPKCLVAGRRQVSVEMELVSNVALETTALYQAASQRSPISAMFQLGQQENQLCGVYLPAVVPEVPAFEDDDTRLHWRFRDCRAQGVGNDEITVAFG